MKRFMMALLLLSFSVASQASDKCYSNFSRLNTLVLGAVDEDCISYDSPLKDVMPFAPVKLILAYGDLATRIRRAGELVQGTGRTYNLDGDAEIIASAKMAAEARKDSLKERLSSINQIPADLVCMIGYIDSLNGLYKESNLQLSGYCRHDLAWLATACADPSQIVAKVCYLQKSVFSGFMSVSRGDDPDFETGVVAEDRRLNKKAALKKWKTEGRTWVKLQPEPESED